MAIFHTQVLEQGASNNIGDYLNMTACAVVFFVSFLFAIVLHRKIVTGESEKNGRAFIASSGTYWTLAWASWSLLYAAKIWGLGVLSDELFRLSLLGLSDLNSLCLFFVFYLISRGEQSTQDGDKTIRKFFVFLGACLVAIDGGLALLGKWVCSDPTSFVVPWSIALSVVAPFLVGRSFRNRYGTNSIWVLAGFYSLMQPLAYGVTFSEVEKREATIAITVRQSEAFEESGPNVPPIPEKKRHGDWVYYTFSVSRYRDHAPDLIRSLDEAGVPTHKQIVLRVALYFDGILFSLLAIMKLVWGATVLACLQSLPKSLSCTVVVFSPRKPWEALVEHWKWYYYGQLGIAVAIVMVAMVLLDMSVTMVHGVVAAVVGLALLIAKGNKTVQDLFGGGQRGDGGTDSEEGDAEEARE